MSGGVGLAENKLRADGARALEPALREMPQLTYLDLSSECSGLVVLRWLVCWLLVLSAVWLVSGLRMVGVMGCGVGLAGNYLEAEGARALEPALREMLQLTHLGISGECSGLLVLSALRVVGVMGGWCWGWQTIIMILEMNKRP